MRDQKPNAPPTYADLIAVPDTMLSQIIDGELVTTPHADIPHSVAASTLGADLGGPFQRGRGGPGGWWVLRKPDLKFGDDFLVPDLAGWRRERMPVPPKAPYLELPPDWVCEVLSPSTARIDRVRKNRIYAERGVRWLWFVDPSARTLETFELRDGAWVQLGAWANDDRPRAVPFDAIEIELAALWLPEAPE